MQLFACIVASVALLLATLALWRVLTLVMAPKELRRAFEALEEEFEDQRDHVRTALGRISRLKRAVTSPGAPEVPEDSESASAQETLPGLTPRQAAFQAKILARRNRGSVQ